MARSSRRLPPGSKSPSNIPPGSTYKLEPETRFFICLLLAFSLYFIAASIGSGWIFLMAAGLLAALAAGLALPADMVAGVSVEASCPAQATAGESLKVNLTFKHPQGSLWHAPVHWLLVSYLPLNLRERTSAHPSRNTSNKDSLPLPQQAPLLIESLTNEETIVWHTAPLERGVYLAAEICLESAYPLGIAWSKRKVCTEARITVYPKVVPIAGQFLYKLSAAGAGTTGVPRGGSAHQSTYTRGVRAYARGDSPRTIHWVSSARQAKLMVREFDAEGLPLFDIFIDLCAPWRSYRQFELAVTTVASLLYLGQRNAIHPELYISGQANLLDLDLPASLPGIEMDMEILARLSPAKNKDPKLPFAHPRARQRTLVTVCPDQSACPPCLNSYYIEVADSPASRTSMQNQPGSSRLPAADSSVRTNAPSLYSRNNSATSSLVAGEEDISLL